MSFHVEIRRSFRRASAFNLDEPRLLAIVGPWRRGELIEFGDQEWDPRDCKLRILDGPHLDAPDLGMGQGWANAERSSEDVTERYLARPPDPVPGIVIVAVGDAPIPAALEPFEAVRMDPDDPEAAKALIERLRQANRLR